jgi:hypothetical protein
MNFLREEKNTQLKKKTPGEKNYVWEIKNHHIQRCKIDVFAYWNDNFLVWNCFPVQTTTMLYLKAHA